MTCRRIAWRRRMARHAWKTMIVKTPIQYGEDCGWIYASSLSWLLRKLFMKQWQFDYFAFAGLSFLFSNILHCDVA